MIQEQQQSERTPSDSSVDSGPEVKLLGTEPQHSLKRDIEDIRSFYLTDDARARVEDMGNVQQSVYITAAVLKSMFLKLTPARRLMLGIAVLLFFAGMDGALMPTAAGFLALLFILMLELKDKLLAQDELAAGRAVQFALMPERSPNLPGWTSWVYSRPANDVGGDLVDHLRLSEDRLFVTVGDVAGKGLPAALFMARLQATLRALASDTSEMSALGERVNAIFYRDGLRERFASVLHLDVRANDGHLSVLNAGHFPPIVVRASGRLESLPHGGPALGMIRDATYEVHSLSLEPGDAVVVYTDGVTEARDEMGTFFGEERFRRTLSSSAGSRAAVVGRNIVESVERFVGEARPTDDLSLVVLTRTADQGSTVVPSRAG
jgi:hypothetical protein